MRWTRRHCHRCKCRTTTALSSSRAPNNRRSELLDDDLAVHPRMRRADVIIVTRLSEGNGLRLALLQYAGVPIALPVGGCGVRDVADIGEGYGGPRFDPSPG